MSLFDVRAALLTRATSSAPGAAIPVSLTWFENKRHMSGNTEVAPPTDAIWYRIIDNINDKPETDGIGVGAKIRHTGFFQIDVCEPRDNGDVLVKQEAERIMGCFKQGLHLLYGSQDTVITKCGMHSGMFDATGAYVVAVRVLWMADVAN